MDAPITHTPLFKTVLLVPLHVPNAVTRSPGYVPLDSILRRVSLRFYFRILEYQNVRLPVSRIPRHRWHVSKEQGNIIIVPRAILHVLLGNTQESNEIGILKQGCALAESGGPWCLTFALGRVENLRFFIQIIIMLGTLDFTVSGHWAPFSFP